MEISKCRNEEKEKLTPNDGDVGARARSLVFQLCSSKSNNTRVNAKMEVSKMRSALDYNME
jgi:hypothetical protein